MSSTAINDVLNQLDIAVQTYVFKGYASLSQTVEAPLHMALIAYIAFVGWSTTQHWSPFTTGTAVKHVLKMVLVVMISTHWDFFSTMLYDVVTNGPNQLANILVGSQGTDVDSSNQAMQNVFNAGIEKGNEVWKKGGSLSFGFYLASILIYLFDYLSIGFALLEISVAKCGLGLTVVLAPVFAGFLLFDSGRGVFDGWLKTLLGFALVPLILTSVMMIMTPILEKGLDAINPKLMENGMSCLSAFILGSFACIGLLLKTAQMASTIGGGIGVSAMETASGFGRGAGKVGSLGAKAGRWAKNKIQGNKK